MAWAAKGDKIAPLVSAEVGRINNMVDM
jgi:hypothetical protein